MSTNDFHQMNGLLGSSYLYFISKHFRRGLISLPLNEDLEVAKDCLRYFSKSESIYTFPAFERGYEPVREEPEISVKRIETQMELARNSGKDIFILSHFEALSQKVTSPKEILQGLLELKRGGFIEREELIQKLRERGYRQDDLAEDQGFFSIRGHLVDIFSPHETLPHRIEFFGDEIVSIRTFHPETQRSLTELEHLAILPCREILISKEKMKLAKERLKNLGDERGISREDREKVLEDLENQRDVLETHWLLPAFSNSLVSLIDYLPEDFPRIYVDESISLADARKNHERDHQDYESCNRLAFGPSLLLDDPEKLLSYPHHSIQRLVGGAGLTYHVETFDLLRPRLLKAKSFAPLIDLILDLQEKIIPVTLVLQGPKRKEALAEALSDRVSVEWTSGPPFDGFQSSTFHHAWITEKDIFGVRRKRSALSKNTTEEFLRQFSDLKDGDYVIHEDHGIGKFRGLRKLHIHGVTSELLLLEYAGADKLYLPIYKLDKISRYISEGYAHPRLDKLGSKTFQKKKAKIRKDILKVAHELLDIAAQRKLHSMERKTIDQKVYQEFCQSFPYELTPDQENAISEIENDLKKPFAMDRLVCGDVGFGKTEVAMRAAIDELLQGKQVALLAPTTLLVEQHLRTFQRRFNNFSFRIERLSRFVGLADQKRILNDVKAGKVQILIGTHRLLQPDIQFSDLGLLVVDEEQRFGVKHKEKIKKWKASIDVLSLSATPIPRTLQMSILGIRELSLITTPPDVRQAVRTHVGTWDPGLVRKACLREKDRGGQIFIVHNRVQSIQKFADQIRKVVPECRLIVGHGQMPETELEKTMFQFIDGKVDILVATSIIENGLDIPNANTLIVDHTELFGLSDLYQLRGRVGRGSRTSYAYFLVREDTPLTVEASKRLQVIQSCTELGSGFRVATHDLEIRGSGNILGEEQSGIIAEVGLELYTQMLQETLAEIKSSGMPEPLPELNSGYTAYLPEIYIPDPSVRIATYKHLNKAKTPSELLILEEEVLDRFGLYPKEVENLFQILRLRTLAHALKASQLDCFPGRLTLSLSPQTPLVLEKIIPLLGKDIQLDPKGRLIYQFESAVKKPELIRDAKQKGHPERYDFNLCATFLKKLMDTSTVALEAV